MPQPQDLTESVGMTQFSVIQEDRGSGKLVIRGEFGRVDVPTQNGRIYSRKLVRREFDRLAESISNRAVYGECDHPSDGKTKFSRVSHIITKLDIEDDGRVMGEAEVLRTPAGNILRAIVEAKGSLGVSSRGFGSVESQQDGTSRVCEDFKLKTYDVVVDPAMESARPEAVQEALMEANEYDWLGELKDEFPEVYAQVEEEVKSDVAKKAEDAVTVALEAERAGASQRFERRLKEALVGVRGDVEESIRADQERDPRLAGSVAVLGHIAEMVSTFDPDPDHAALRDAMKAGERKVARLESESAKWRRIAKDAGYKLCVEREISGHPKAEEIRGALGNMSQFDSMDELKVAVLNLKEGFTDTLPGDNDAQTQEEAIVLAEIRGEKKGLEEQISVLSAQNDSLQTENGTLKSKLQRAVHIGEELNDQLTEAKVGQQKVLEEHAQDADEAYKARLEAKKQTAVRGHANGANLLKLLESAESEAEINTIVKTHGSTTMTDSALGRIRDRIQRGQVHDGQDDTWERPRSGPTSKNMIPLDEETSLDLDWIVNTATGQPPG